MDKQAVINLLKATCNSCGHKAQNGRWCMPNKSLGWNPITNNGCENYLSPERWKKERTIKIY